MLFRSRIVDDEEIKQQLAAEHPYGAWLGRGLVEFDDLPEREHTVFSHDSVLRRQQMFGYTHEELKVIVAPMARTGAEPIGSMGTDTPIAVLSQRPRLLFDYFQQLFAQVTNPPLDAIREELVTSVQSVIGPEGNLLDTALAETRELWLRDAVWFHEPGYAAQQHRQSRRTHCRAPILHHHPYLRVVRDDVDDDQPEAEQRVHRETPGDGCSLDREVRVHSAIPIGEQPGVHVGEEEPVGDADDDAKAEEAPEIAAATSAPVDAITLEVKVEAFMPCSAAETK